VQPITLAVLENGSIFWNDEPVTKGLLESKLSVEAQKTPQPAINVRGDRTTKYRVVSEIVNIAQAQGMRKVGFVAEPELTR
jgi:biopolymer transport protein ExbD